MHPVVSIFPLSGCRPLSAQMPGLQRKFHNTLTNTAQILSNEGLLQFGSKKNKNGNILHLCSNARSSHTLDFLQLHQLLVDVSQLISVLIQNGYHLSEQSEAICFSRQPILSRCDRRQPRSQDISLSQAAAEPDE